jgi:hypothetical protein
MAHANYNLSPLKPIKEESMIQNSNQINQQKADSQNKNQPKTENQVKSQAKQTGPVVEKVKKVNNEDKNQVKHVPSSNDKNKYESNQNKPAQKEKNPIKNQEKVIVDKSNSHNVDKHQNISKPTNSDDKEPTFHPPSKRHTELDPEYKKKVLEKYRSFLIRDQCGRCKMLGIFVCEHNTSVRDSFKNRVLHEGTFYRSPRRSQSIEGNNSLIDRDNSPEKSHMPNKNNSTSKNNNFEKNQFIQQQINEVKKTESKDNRHEVKKP